MSTEEFRGGSPDAARPLLERDTDLAVLTDALAEAATGEGRIVLVEGPPGIGKTVLLGELRRTARADGVVVLAARGGELEVGFGFGVVRQLLEPWLVAEGRSRLESLLTGPARLAEPVFAGGPSVEDGEEITYATLHGLYWLVANLAEQAPLVLVVDDVQWADEPSLRFLNHLARRLAGLPVLLALASRTGTGADRATLQSLLLEAAEPIVRPRPLTDVAVQRLLGSGLGGPAPPALAQACREATGGNPFLLSELIGDLRRPGGPEGIDPATVRGLGPKRIAAGVLLRVGSLGPDAAALARAVAALGEHAETAVCAGLAGLPPARVQELAGAMVELAVLGPGEPLRFVHPIVRTAIYDDIPPSRRAGLHARAARLLSDRFVEPASIAVHLMRTEPAERADVVTTLRAAARAAMAAGAPDTAAELLRRALREPPDDPAAVLFDLGTAEHELGEADALRRLTEAADASRDPVQRSRALVRAASIANPNAAQLRGLIGPVERASAEVRPHDRELALELEAIRLGGLLLNPDLPTGFSDEVARFRDLPGRTAAECILLSFVARADLASGAPVDHVADLAERAAAHPALSTHGTHPIWRTNITICLNAAERYEATERLASRELARAERTGSPMAFGRAAVARAVARYRRGDLRGAEVDVRASLDAGRHPHPLAAYFRINTLVDSLTEQGRLDEATALLAEHGVDGDLAPILPSIWMLLSRGRLRAATGEFPAARLDLLEALHRLELFRGLLPVGGEIRAALVPVLDELGERDDAAAQAELALCGATAARSRPDIGDALRVAGLVRGGAAGLTLLHRAADTLADSPSLLRRAQAAVDHGAALRRDGRHVDARTPLRDGMDLAHRCAATPLVERARGELIATGARPRRLATSGVDALTASERRVAELAATGKTNKEIAQSLFVTVRAVEMHLSNSYAKLEISSRDQLGRSLAD
jgi:DNA-binding CsgD family transcriptional regulator